MHTNVVNFWGTRKYFFVFQRHQSEKIFGEGARFPSRQSFSLKNTMAGLLHQMKPVLVRRLLLTISNVLLSFSICNFPCIKALTILITDFFSMYNCLKKTFVLRFEQKKLKKLRHKCFTFFSSCFSQSFQFFLKSLK